MKSFRIGAALMLALTVAVSAAAQSRGNLRVTGRVLDELGKPVVKADVRAAKKGEVKPEVFAATTDEKGEYTLKGLAAGDWIVGAAKEGIGVTEVSATLVADQRTTTVDIVIAKPAPPPPDPSVEINREHQRAIQLAQQDKIAEARKIYEDLLVKFPQVYQLHAMLAGLYAGEGNAAKGQEHIKLALEKEPENVEFKLLQADLMMELKDAEGARKVLESVDLTQVKDPRAFINLAISDINAGKPDEGVALLTKLMAQFPNDASLFYYRGRAYIKAEKLPEAKADLEKFVAAAPTAPQAEDAKRLLEQIKK